MNFRVYWRQRSLNLLGQFLFMEMELGREPDPLDRAYDEINRLLAEDPSAVGESREEPERVLIVDPLAVRYEVFPTEGVVVIYQMVYRRFPNVPG